MDLNMEKVRSMKVRCARALLTDEVYWSKFSMKYVNCSEEERKELEDFLSEVVSGIKFPFNGYSNKEEMFSELINRLDVARSRGSYGRNCGRSSHFNEKRPKK